ncbi:S-formylglutathione hydrolase [Aureimonas fodinaquatilis]|uniref:S-formylglutathione hydrolase n=1 Tax=Aureimonas fodinaquatilis TaxID=2565783 RepID=A0A5B0DSP9_9HYPH|nr:S-formylglutathione hydrolase [Aureimonas fodinaquatilis]KAA0969413.1 S-formylglutathione hydrolase [Aureimonas fodinaquatilis]
MDVISTAKAHGGVQGVYRHRSRTTDCDMTFAVFVPEHQPGEKLAVLTYLSGLTCTHQNVMDKGEFRRAAAKHRLIIVTPDTSPRGADVPDEPDNWQFGSGAGFYVDATEAPYNANYRMYSYITDELPALLAVNFPVATTRQGIFGHSMGGHGAMTIALKNPDIYRSCSAFAPIVHPARADWSRPAFEKYLGADAKAWRDYDTCLLIEDGKRFPGFLVDQGTDDQFLENGLRPELLKAACETARIPLTLNMREGYDHSYNFISTFMDDHLAWHAKRLKP